VEGDCGGEKRGVMVPLKGRLLECNVELLLGRTGVTRRSIVKVGGVKVRMRNWGCGGSKITIPSSRSCFVKN